MHRYFFVLGRNPTLPLSEIVAVFSSQKISHSFECLSSEVAVFVTDKSLDVTGLMAKLGGTIKIGEITDEFRFEEDVQKFENLTKAEYVLGQFLSKSEGKLHIGVSVYKGGAKEELFDQFVKRAASLSQEIKENLREKNIRIGFVQQKERYLSSVSVEKNKLLTKGAEIIFIVTDKKILVGKTLAVQEFEKFSLRDFERPYKDKRSGIMPPKLARMMIHLSGLDMSGTLLDPFCGSGTIVQEACVLGYRNIVGCDVSKNAIAGTLKNLDWLFQSVLKQEKTSYNIKLIETDVRLLTKAIPTKKVDAIVTEPFLGPALFQKPSLSQIQRTFQQLIPLYTNAFSEFARVIIPHANIIIIFPVFSYNEQFYYMEILDHLRKMGFVSKKPISDDIPNASGIFVTHRNSIIYGGDQDFTIREILSFQK